MDLIRSLRKKKKFQIKKRGENIIKDIQNIQNIKKSNSYNNKNMDPYDEEDWENDNNRDNMNYTQTKDLFVSRFIDFYNQNASPCFCFKSVDQSLIQTRFYLINLIYLLFMILPELSF